MKKPVELIETVREVPAYLLAERTVLGALLLESERYTDAWETVEPDDFSIHDHQMIWLRMWELHEEKKAVDLVTVQNALAKDDVSVAYLTDLIHGLPRRPVIGDYLKILRDKRKLRAIILACNEAIDAAYLGTDPIAIVHTLRENLKAGKALGK